MYLLKRQVQTQPCCSRHQFTFHHVSIKTMEGTKKRENEIHSHSTMYLLKLLHFSSKILMSRFTFHHVSIKTII